MNRLVLIGNGFDLAHGLPTRYEDFINWYWDQRVREFWGLISNVSSDPLCLLEIAPPNVWNQFAFELTPFPQHISGKDVICQLKENQSQYKITMSPFFENICRCIETKKWVDIENEYYVLLKKYALKDASTSQLCELNNQLHHIQIKLAEYLLFVSTNNKDFRLSDSLWQKIYAPIDSKDISVESFPVLNEHIKSCLSMPDDSWKAKQSQYALSDTSQNQISSFKDSYSKGYYHDYPDLFMLPDWILFVNFNYTFTANPYICNGISSEIHIHGDISNPDKMIFGYGDEMDENYSDLQNRDDQECLRNIKSIKYLESDNYRNVLAFIGSAPYQIYILGHSCGNSDRTLINTLFEHKNCISIKPYYHQKADGSDNYLDIIQNISRNFTNMKLMRDRVVNKTYCEPLPQANS